MLGIFQAILMAVAVVVCTVMIVAATKSRQGRLSRSVEIKAPPEKIFPHIDNLRSMNVWNPFAKSDPNMQAGAGHIRTLESAAPSFVRLNLVMSRPFACDNIVEFALTPKGESTIVTWSIQGPSPYWMRVTGLLLGMEKMMHRTLDKGLFELKGIVERA